MASALRCTSRLVSATYRAAACTQPPSFQAFFSFESTIGTKKYTTSNSDLRSVFSSGAASPIGPYSQAIKTKDKIYVSGQLPADRHGNLVTGSMGEKTEACIDAIQQILAQAGSGLDKIVKVTIFLSDMKHFKDMNETYERMIVHKPARSCVAVKELPRGVDVEIECIALT